MFVYHYPERSNTHVSVILTVVDWSKDDSTYRFLLSTAIDGWPATKSKRSYWITERGGTSHSVFVIPAIDHLGICSWQTVKLCTACWFRPSPSFSLLLSRMVYHCVVLSLQFFASCVAWDPSFQEVCAWQGTWKHDFKCFSHEYIYIYKDL